MALRSLDLMIGDWIIFHDSGYASDGTTWEENRVCQIDSIDEDVRVKWYDESGYKEDWPHISTMGLSPIPLAPEILEKNFEGKRNIFGLQTYILDENFSLEDRRTRFCLVRSSNGYTDFKFWVCDIMYVHQLQHALKLFNIEKEIEL